MDPIYNEPMPFKTAGREFTVRELPARLVRSYMQQYLRVSMDSLNQGLTGQQILDLMKDPNAAGSILSLVDPSLLITNYWDLSIQVIADAAGEDPASIGDLPIGSVLDLADEVIRIHGRYITRFFHTRDVVQGLLGGGAKQNGGTPGPSSKPATSPGSSERGSNMEPSEI